LETLSLFDTRCVRCDRFLPEEAFSPSQRHKSGVWCRSCRKEHDAHKKKKKTLVCAHCGGAMWNTPRSGSLPQGQAVCRPCRKTYPKHGPYLSEVKVVAPLYGPWLVEVTMIPTKELKTGERGLGYAHQQMRKRLLPKAYGQPCALCGYLMVQGQRLDLDHVIPRKYGGIGGPVRIVHASCNRSQGARLGNRLRHGVKPLDRRVSRW
jgi:hypothetical protein